MRIHWRALWARRISNIFLGLWQAWKERKKSPVLPGRGIVWAKVEEKSFKTWKNRKFSHSANLFSAHHHFPPNHSPQVRELSGTPLLAGSSQSLGTDRCCPFHKLSDSFVSVPRATAGISEPDYWAYLYHLLSLTHFSTCCQRNLSKSKFSKFNPITLFL